MTDITIDLTDADALPATVDPGTKITWHNSTAEVITLNPPSCVSPQQAVDISAGGDSRQFTVNNSSKGNYNYTFNVGDGAGLRSGTINVN